MLVKLIKKLISRRNFRRLRYVKELRDAINEPNDKNIRFENYEEFMSYMK